MRKGLGIKGCFLSLLLVSATGLAQAGEVFKSNPPAEYVVKKGDTLWDIAGVFLHSPWLWTSIWEKNSQIKNPHLIYPEDVIVLGYRDGKPYLSIQKTSRVKLGPKVRAVNRFSPISSIPKSALKAFVDDHRIVPGERIEKMPYILASAGLRTLVASGDEVYVRGLLDPDFVYYDVYREGRVFGEEQGFATDNVEIINVGQIKVISRNDGIAKATIVRSSGVIRPGDIIVRAQALSIQSLYYLAAAPAQLSGEIVDAVDPSYKIAHLDGVILNLGKKDSVVPGHVFRVLKEVESIIDPRTEEEVFIEDEEIAEIMVVSVFENLSYAIVVSASKILSPGDAVKTVK